MRLSSRFPVATLALSAAIFSGCAVVPEVVEEPPAPPIVVEVPPAPTCFEVASLQRVEIPAETKTIVGISLIENPPYDPIEQRTEQKIVTKQAEVFYVVTDPATGNQTEVTDFCDESIQTGPIGPAPGEAFGTPTQG